MNSNKLPATNSEVVSGLKNTVLYIEENLIICKYAKCQTCKPARVAMATCRTAMDRIQEQSAANTALQLEVERLNSVLAGVKAWMNRPVAQR